jgi:hypothetical protein
VKSNLVLISDKGLSNSAYFHCERACIDGEFTEEKEAAMLKELERITKEEYSGMQFTVDPVTPECADKSIDNNEQQRCEKKKIKQ